MLNRFLIGFILSIGSAYVNSTNLELTTLDKRKLIKLKNASIVCDGKNIGDNLLVNQDGARSQIPMQSLALLRSLQHPSGFYIKSNNGKEQTGNHMACSDYEWIGENVFGGFTSVGGDKWHLIKIKG